jgi:hypothetical protein
LREVVKLGLIGGYGGDDEIQHQRQLSEVESFWQSTGRRHSSFPIIKIWARPKLFRVRRWADAETLENLLRDVGPHTDRFHRYPPQPTGNAPMDWGLYNDTYGDPWTITYAGQFWTSIRVGGQQPLTLSERDMSVSPERPESNVLREGEWVMADYALGRTGTVFQFVRNLAEQFGDSEVIHLGFDAVNTQRKWLHFDNWASMGPCKAPKLHREIKVAAVEFRKRWADLFADIGKDFCDLFCRDGRVVGRDDVKDFINAAGDF